MKEFNSYLEKASLESEKFIFLNPSDILCKDNICRNLDKRKYLIYSDSSHLSKYGSIEVIEGFKSEILEIINKK
ncbi:SGNH hydrolase domain-containing protein [Aliarcobacter butzleri]|uniref:SGNH hydrolase domain-containing protein n=1 Tax=Aliarcobacter butzleri TaxID=28197 RepID=UPI00390835DF